VQGVYLEQLNIVVINIYKPPSTPTKPFLDKLTLLIKQIKNTHKDTKIVAGGDYNIDILKDNTNKQDLQLAAIEMGLTPIIEEPTRIGGTTTTSIDNILTDVRNYKCGVLDWSVADHLPIFIQVTKKVKKENQQQKSRDFSSRAIAYFLELTRKTDWKDVLEDHTETCFPKFHNKIQECLDIACPVTMKKINHNRNQVKIEPWMSNGLMISRKTKTKLLRKTIAKPKRQDHRDKYRLYNKIYMKCIKKAKTKHIQEQLELNQNNPRKTWQIINEITGRAKPKEQLPNEFMTENGIDNTPAKIAIHFSCS
jgi:hypothetical protein